MCGQYCILAPQIWVVSLLPLVQKVKPTQRGMQNAVGMQHAVGTEYAVGVSAKRSTHTVH